MADSTSKLLLCYWNVRGRTQPVRFFLEYLGLPYEEKRYELANAMDWFAKDKNELNCTFPNLPYLKDGDKIVTETDALFHYLARKANKKDLLGKEEHQVDLMTARGAI
mmetsp:Transcript_40419/g.35877  ORF Transcript_40419/g.35877 Transcript_40419/m.35877 type:complete len:108 (+) Transcript_40419:83-406(+)